MLDVELVGELGPDAAGGPHGGAAGELVALEQDHVARARLGEVEGGAGADHAAADDHHPARSSPMRGEC